MNKTTVDLICRALLAIVAALRKEYNLPEYHGITIMVSDKDDVAGAVDYRGTMQLIK
jgi:hypothetical protein